MTTKTRKAKTKTDPTKAIAYVRVSTDDQSNGPHAQRAAIEAWAARQGIAIVAWHEDLGVSGTAAVDKRPALLAALADVELLGAGVLVAMKRDRVARDAMAAAMIDRLATKAGARVVTADGVGNGDGPEAMLLRTMLDAFAQYEAAVIRARTKAALQSRKARGLKWTGSLPIGLAADEGTKAVEAHETEGELVRHVLELRARGVSLRGIAAKMNEAFAPPRKAKTWHVTQVRRILEAHEGEASREAA